MQDRPASSRLTEAERARVGQRIEALRLARGLSREEMTGRLRDEAQRACTVCHYGRIVSGKVKSIEKWLSSFAIVLGVPEGLLLSEGQLQRTRRTVEAMGFRCRGTLDLRPHDSSVRCFDGELHNGIVPSRVTVVCAPLVHQELVDQGLRELAARPCPPDSVLFVSELRSGADLVSSHARSSMLPGYIVASLEDLDRSILDLDPLFEQYNQERSALQRRPLRPRIGFRGEEDSTEPHTFLTRWLKDSACHLLLVGEAGSGKSQILHRFKVELADEWRQEPGATPFPVFISLASWWNSANLKGSLITALLDQVHMASRLAVERALESGAFVLLLDGLDELVGTDPTRWVFVERALEPILNIGCRVVLTARTPLMFSREYLFDAVPVPGQPGGSRPPVRQAVVHPLSAVDVCDFVAAHTRVRSDLRGQIERHGLMELARLPYILDMLVEIQDATADPFENGVPVLPQVLDRCYQQWLQAETIHTGFAVEELRHLLGVLAAELRRLGRPICRTDRHPERLMEFLFSPRLDAPRHGARSNRFVHVADDMASFVHLLVERYFFCSWLAERVREGQTAGLQRQWITVQDSTILAGMIRDPVSVRNLLAWVRDAGAPSDLRDLSAYLLGFTGAPDVVLPALRRIAENADHRSLVESAEFSCVLLGDRDLLDRYKGLAQGTEGGRKRTSARLQLLALGLHRRLLPLVIQREVDLAIESIPRPELIAELRALVLSDDDGVTTLAAAAVGLGYLGAEEVRPLLEGLVEAYASRGALDRSPDRLRLAIAARSALEMLPLQGGDRR